MTRARSIRIVVGVLAAAMVLTGCDWAELGFGPAGTSENTFRTRDHDHLGRPPRGGVVPDVHLPGTHAGGGGPAHG